MLLSHNTYTWTSDERNYTLITCNMNDIIGKILNIEREVTVTFAKAKLILSLVDLNKR